jgi:hypothetical protein
MTPHASIVESRAGQAELLSDHTGLEETDYLKGLLNALPYSAGIVNRYHQIVLANKLFLEKFGQMDPDSLLGARPGEIWGCIHARENPGGCGTTRSCKVCGTYEALQTSIGDGTTVVRECRISACKDEKPVPFDYRITASPFYSRGKVYTLVSLIDISDEKRRQSLERIFFHDLINTAGGVKGLIEVMKLAETLEEARTFLGDLERVTGDLFDEIMSHRELSAAEAGRLTVKSGPVLSKNLVHDAAVKYSHHGVSPGRFVDILPAAESFIVVTDEILMKRVLGNMVKNALEASHKGERITLDCRRNGDKAVFSVHNPGFIAEEVGLQIFQRSFSTKGSGRGLGTYSMKLLGEFYLKGRVHFTSDKERGTTFYIEIPLENGSPNVPENV